MVDDIEKLKKKKSIFVELKVREPIEFKPNYSPIIDFVKRIKIYPMYGGGLNTDCNYEILIDIPDELKIISVTKKRLYE